MQRVNFNDSVFLPGRLSIFYHPFYIIRRNLFQSIKNEAKDVSGVLLDFGCGKKPYEKLFKNVSLYIGVDIEVSGHNHKNSNIDFYYDGKRLPFEPNTFDIIFASEVLEHVPNHDDIFKEFHRVLKPGGKILITIPFLWGEHEEPYDFIRFTNFGIVNVLQQYGFNQIKVSKIGGSFETLCQLFSAHIFESLPKKRLYQILTLPIIIPINIFGRVLSKTIKLKSNLFHNTITTAIK